MWWEHIAWCQWLCGESTGDMRSCWHETRWTHYDNFGIWLFNWYKGMVSSAIEHVVRAWCSVSMALWWEHRSHFKLLTEGIPIDFSAVQREPATGLKVLRYHVNYTSVQAALYIFPLHCTYSDAMTSLQKTYYQLFQGGSNVTAVTEQRVTC